MGDVIDACIADQGKRTDVKMILMRIWDAVQSDPDAFFKRKHPYIEQGQQLITGIIGEEGLHRLFDTWRKQNPMKDEIKRYVELTNLCKKIQGRKCAYSGCSNQESRDGVIEKYKMC